MDNRNIKTIMFFGILLISISGVFAFGVSSPYWNVNPLEMYPGQEIEVSINLQNCPSQSPDCTKSDESITASLKEGSEIAQITSGTSYTLPYGSANSYLTLKVSIPSSTAIGESYNIKLLLNPELSDNEGTVQLGTEYNVEFPVIIKSQSEIEIPEEQTETPEEEGKINLTLILSILGIIILIGIIIAIIYFVMARKKSSENLNNI